MFSYPVISPVADSGNFAVAYLSAINPEQSDTSKYELRVMDWLVEDGWVIVQIHPVELEPVELQNLVEFDRRQYGSTVVLFYEPKAVAEQNS